MMKNLQDLQKKITTFYKKNLMKVSKSSKFVTIVTTTKKQADLNKFLTEAILMLTMTMKRLSRWVKMFLLLGRMVERKPLG